MRIWFIFSIFLIAVLAGGLAYMLTRLGGWRYALHRLQHDEAGLYAHRRELFTLLPEQPGALVFLGDSHMQACEWRELCGDSLPALNRGIAGDHVAGVAERLGEVLRHRPAGVFLQVGINDLLFDKPTEEIARGYRDILTQLQRESPETRVVVHSILPVNHHVKRIGVNNEVIRALNGRLQEICREMNLPYVNLHAVLTDTAGNLDAEFTDDGIHLNGRGYLRWKKLLEPWLKGL